MMHNIKPLLPRYIPEDLNCTLLDLAVTTTPPAPNYSLSQCYLHFRSPLTKENRFLEERQQKSVEESSGADKRKNQSNLVEKCGE
jgi:hypothetical protein